MNDCDFMKHCINVMKFTVALIGRVPARVAGIK